MTDRAKFRELIRPQYFETITAKNSPSIPAYVKEWELSAKQVPHYHPEVDAFFDEHRGTKDDLVAPNMRIGEIFKKLAPDVLSIAKALSYTTGGEGAHVDCTELIEYIDRPQAQPYRNGAIEKLKRAREPLLPELIKRDPGKRNAETFAFFESWAKSEK